MSKTYMQKEDKDGKGTGEIVCCALNDWAKYRGDGFAFVETDKNGNTPEAQYNKQTHAAPAASKKTSGKKKS